MKKTKVIVVVGPTASGKTALGIHLAKKFGGEIISADSMQIYKGMNIATAKPTKEEQESIPHHLIDFLDVKTEYSVAKFCSDAKKTVNVITNAGNIPIIVGGTGLYIDSFINNTTFLEDNNKSEVRELLCKELKENGIKHLYEKLCKIDAEAANKIHPNNEVKVIRALEIFMTTGKTLTEQNKLSHTEESSYLPLFIGINYKDRNVLYERINKRVDLMLLNGLLDETKDFYENYASKTAVNAIGYKELKPYLDNEKTLQECVEELKKSTRHYAKRQITWFKRNEKINWVYPDEYNNFSELSAEVDLMTEEFLKGE